MELFIDPESNLGTIDKNIFGHFSEHLGSCIYGGLYVGADQDIPNVNGMRSDVVAALKNIKVPVLRWPGGCFASEYHWRDGIGTNRKRISASASLHETGEITVTLSNISLTESAAIDLEADGYTISSHRVLSGEKSAHNTFENPDAVSVRTLPVTGNSVALPPISVSEVVLTRTSK